jgi:hypothetical protein
MKKLIIPGLAILVMATCFFASCKKPDTAIPPLYYTPISTQNPAPNPPLICQPSRLEIPVKLSLLGQSSEKIYNPVLLAAGNKIAIVSPENHSQNNTFQVFDRLANTFTSINPPNIAYDQAIISAGEKIFFAGGFTDMNNQNYGKPTSDIDIYDTKINSWSKANLSEARGGCAAALLGNKLIFAGGINSSKSFSDNVDILDLQNGSWSKTKLNGGARSFITPIIGDNKVIFIGGFASFQDYGWWPELYDQVAAVDIYDNVTNQWSVKKLPSPMRAFAAIAKDNKLYLARGDSSKGTEHSKSGFVDIFDINSFVKTTCELFQPNSWTRYNATENKNEFLIFFIGNGNDKTRFDVFNATTSLWSIGVIPQNLESPSILSVNNELYVFSIDKLYKMDF